MEAGGGRAVETRCVATRILHGQSDTVSAGIKPKDGPTFPNEKHREKAGRSASQQKSF
jgi:hypothetical protein